MRGKVKRLPDSGMKIISACILLFAFMGAAAMAAEMDVRPVPPSIDRAFERLYNFDFLAAHSILDAQIESDPDDALAYSLRAAIYLFSEFHRLRMLETDFFADDNKVTDKKRLKPDPAVRSRIFAATAEARKKAASLLVRKPGDRLALFAMCMAAGLETEYAVAVEKKYLSSYRLAKETQGYARRLLDLTPPFYDAYVTLGSAEYVVANLNFFFRLFAKFDGIQGSRQKAIDNLKLAIDHGRFYQPYAKLLLTVVYLREKRVHDALLVMRELERDYPENPIFKKEALVLAEKEAIHAARLK
jgi:hypothetical protein